MQTNPLPSLNASANVNTAPNRASGGSDGSQFGAALSREIGHLNQAPTPAPAVAPQQPVASRAAAKQETQAPAAQPQEPAQPDNAQAPAIARTATAPAGSSQAGGDATDDKTTETVDTTSQGAAPLADMLALVASFNQMLRPAAAATQAAPAAATAAVTAKGLPQLAAGPGIALPDAAAAAGSDAATADVASDAATRFATLMRAGQRPTLPGRDAASSTAAQLAPAGGPTYAVAMQAGAADDKRATPVDTQASASPTSAPSLAPGGAPTEAPDAVAAESSDTAPSLAPRAAPGLAPTGAPGTAATIAPGAVPAAARVAAVVTPNAATSATAAPGAAPIVQSVLAAAVAPGVASTVVPGAAPTAAPAAALDTDLKPVAATAQRADVPAIAPSLAPTSSPVEVDAALKQLVAASQHADTAHEQPSAQLLAANQVQQAAPIVAQAVAASEHIGARVGTPNWDNQVGQKIVWMVAGGEQSASLTLNPPDLGPMQVVLSVNGDQASVAFSASHQDVRNALENALPRLREMMGDSGISLGSATVGTGMPDQRQAQGGWDGSNGSGGRGNGGTAVADDTPAPRATRTTVLGDRGMVDTFA
jgi:flagellar hook-length control protein FliK